MTLHPSTNFFSSLASQAMTLNENATYNLAIRVEQSGLYDRDYSLKIWEAGTTEPGTWTIGGTQTFSLNEAPATGGIYLNAHYHDVTFNNLAVTEIEGDDILQGSDNDDLLIAVDTTAINPGQGELDVLVGNDGADQFILGNATGSFYDDANGLTDGTADYAFLYDFMVEDDTIQLFGTAADYRLESGATGLPGGTSIWITGTGSESDELIGVVNNVYGLNLDGTEFFFV